MDVASIRLTELSNCAGCAAKLGAAELRSVMERVSPATDDRVLVGYGNSDDAGVYLLSDDLALVSTVDFFTPIVDDPYDFGRIAATNALSDVYAMGGRPLTALNIAAFPEELDLEILSRILDGGASVARAAGVAVIGGHTIKDAEPKYGMAVTGVVHPQHIVTNAGARIGDVLVLTKPLGTGTLTTALKRGAILPEELDEAVRAMTTLNDGAAKAMLAAQAHAATDITGFGLLGHGGGHGARFRRSIDTRRKRRSVHGARARVDRGRHRTGRHTPQRADARDLHPFFKQRARGRAHWPFRRSDVRRFVDQRCARCGGSARTRAGRLRRPRRGCW